MYNTIYPGYVQSYYNINQRQIQQKQDEEKNSESSQNTENESRDAAQKNRNSSNLSYFPNGEKVAIDYTRKQIGIDQILSDFRNTSSAIGTPDDIKQEVGAYLDLVANQAQKDNPNREIIQSNLKNASKILDEYITKTLKKQSRVVEDWVDTLFLQSIDYKTEKQAVPIAQIPAEPDNFEEKTEVHEAIEEEVHTELEEAAEEKEAEENKKPQAADVYVPKDERLKRMFIQAKKYAAIDNKERALYNFQNSLDYAEEIGDTQTQAMIHYEEGKLYYDFNRPEDALYNFAKSAFQTHDNNLKARAYLEMGRIYDDYVNFEPALEHYSAAASYAGEADNLRIQSKALSDLAQMHTQRYDKEHANMFMKLAAISANSSDDDKLIGVIYSKNAKMQSRLGDKARALTSYSTSSQAFSNISENEGLAKNYREAAILMKSYGNYAKAQTLLDKAYSAAQKTENAELKLLILQDMESV